MMACAGRNALVQQHERQRVAEAVQKKKESRMSTTVFIGSGDTTITGAGQQHMPAVTVLAGGGYVVAWVVEPATSADVSQVHAQRFDASGAKVGPELVLNDAPAYGTPSLVAQPGGGFVATWNSSPDTAPTDYIARAFDASGTPLTPELRANDVTNADPSARPLVTVGLPGGGFVMEWWADSGAPNYWGPVLQTFDAGGHKVGGNVTLAPNIESVTMTAAAGGGYDAIWAVATSAGTTDYVQRFDSAGHASGAPLQLVSTGVSLEAITLAGGNIVLTSQTLVPNTGETGLNVQVLAPDGHPLSGAAATGVNGYLLEHQVTALADGGFVVSWMGWNSAGSPVMAQHFDASGANTGPAFQVGTVTGQWPWYSVAATADGGAVFAWDSTSADPGDVHVQRFTPPPPDTTPPSLVWADPANGESWVTPDNSTLWFRFSEDVSAQAAAGPIVLKTADGTVVASWDQLSVEFMAHHWGHLTLPAPLAANAAYHLQLPAGSVADVSGNPIAALGIDFHTGLAPQNVAAPVFAGGPIDQANTQAAGDQTGPSIARLADGSLVVVWTSNATGGTSVADMQIHGQRYDASGAHVGGEMVLEQGAAGASVTALQGGGFVLTWSGPRIPYQGTTTMFEQRFDNEGQPLGGPVAPNTTQDVYLHPSKTVALSDGGYLVVMSERMGGDVFASTDILAQRFDASGAKAGGEMHLGSAMTGWDVTAVGSGGWALVTENMDFRYGGLNREQTTVFDGSGAVVRTMPDFGAGYFPGAVTLANGNVVISDGSQFQVLDAAGAPMGAPVDFKLPGVPALAPLADGGFMATWNERDAAGNSTGMVDAQYFDAAAHEAGGVMRVPGANIVGTPDGGFVAAFAVTNPATGKDIDVQKFAVVSARPAPSPGATVQGTAGNDNLTGTSGNDRLAGMCGNDAIDGGGGTDTAVLPDSVGGVQSYSIGSGQASVTTASGTVTLRNIERVQFADALFALDTHPGEHTWEAAALFHAGFGVLPGRADLSHWTAQADASSSMGELAQHMIDFYAPGVSSHDLVAYLYQQLTHQAPSADVVQSYVDQIGAGKTFATQGELLAYAANLSLNTDGIAAIVGSAQQLDPAAF
jgi:hypothetical protein